MLYIKEIASVENGALRPNKKRRIINSCQNCRLKKLKCDKTKPICSTCSKLGLECLYYVNHLSKSAHDLNAIEETIRNLNEQIEALENQRDKLSESIKDANDELFGPDKIISLHRSLSLFSCFKNDACLKILLAHSRGNWNGRSYPPKLADEFDRTKKQIQKIDTIKTTLIQTDQSLYDLILPTLSIDADKLRPVINHFFDSELYPYFSYIIRDRFLTKFENFINPLPTKIEIDDDYLFIGQILMILRISWTSFYNCGTFESIGTMTSIEISSEVFLFAQLCLNKVEFPIHHSTLEYVQLALMIEKYQLYSPEAVACIDNLITLDVNRLVTIAVTASYNIEPSPENPDADSIRRMWHALVELDYIKLLGDGTPLSISKSIYTTKIPRGNANDNEARHAITLLFDERNKVYSIMDRLSNLLADVRNGVRLTKLMSLLNSMHSYNANNNLDNILKLDSETSDQRIVKGMKFTNLLDLTLLVFMLSYHVLINTENDKDPSSSLVALRWLLESTNTILTLTYFLDPDQNHHYNLHKHFGYNYSHLFKILQLQHRGFHFLLSLLMRSNYLSMHYKNNPVYEKIKQLVSNNIRVILGCDRKVSGHNVYGKRLHMSHAYLVLKNFGHSVETIISPPVVESLNDLNIFNKDYDVESRFRARYGMVPEIMVELSGDREVLSSSIYDYEDTDISEILNEIIVFDLYTIDQLEMFLDQESSVLQ